MIATFQNSVDVLVKAYLNDTLEHGLCKACAVGNLVQAAHGDFDAAVPLFCNGKGWPIVFCTMRLGYQKVNFSKYSDPIAKAQIDSTGYSPQELARIEASFERHNPSYTGGEDEDKAMLNGLMAVVDVLAEIHGVDLSVKESAKLLFVKA